MAYIDQINRLASSQAKVDLLPGNQPGTSLVVNYRTEGGSLSQHRQFMTTKDRNQRASIGYVFLLKQMMCWRLMKRYSVSLLSTKQH